MTSPPVRPVPLPVRAVLASATEYVPGSLVIADGRIAARAGAPAAAPPDWFAIPGLRNAHVHLDLTDVFGVRRADRGFAAWVKDLIRARPFDARFLAAGAEHGAALALASGTTAVGDIESSGAAAAAVARSGLRGFAFREFLGSRSAGETRSAAEEWGARFAETTAGGRVRCGFSPHAPYSTAPTVYGALAQVARSRGAGFTTHAAETLAEARFVRDGGGELAALLRDLGAPTPLGPPPGVSPIEHLDRIGALFPGALLAHANYPEPGDVSRLARSGACVAYCPRSHRFFGHARHPVLEYRAAGIPVALGTDSLASNASLSMFDEMAYLRAARPDLDPAFVFEMATAAGARVLDDGSGRLDPGEPADLVVCASDGGAPKDLAEALDRVTLGRVRVVATVVSGEICFASGEAEAGQLPLTPRGAGLFSRLLHDRSTSSAGTSAPGEPPAVPAPGAQ